MKVNGYNQLIKLNIAQRIFYYYYGNEINRNFLSFYFLPLKCVDQAGMPFSFRSFEYTYILLNYLSTTEKTNNNIRETIVSLHVCVCLCLCVCVCVCVYVCVHVYVNERQERWRCTLILKKKKKWKKIKSNQKKRMEKKREEGKREKKKRNQK